MEDLVSDRPVQMPAIRSDMYPPQGGDKGDGSTVVKLTVRPAVRQNAGLVYTRAPGKRVNNLSSDGATISEIVAFAYDLPQWQVIVSKYLAGGKYALDAWVPEDRGDLLKPLVKSAMEAAIDYRSREEQRTFDVLVLSGAPGKFTPV